MNIFGKILFFQIFIEKKSVYRRKFVFSPKRKVVAQNNPQKSIPGVKNCRYRTYHAYIWKRYFFAILTKDQNWAWPPAPPNTTFFNFLRDSVCITIMNIYHHKLAFLLIVYMLAFFGYTASTKYDNFTNFHKNDCHKLFIY